MNGGKNLFSQQFGGMLLHTALNKWDTYPSLHFFLNDIKFVRKCDPFYRFNLVSLIKE